MDLKEPVAGMTVAVQIPQGLCTASILSDDLVLTSAHCTSLDPTQMTVIFRNDVADIGAISQVLDYRIPSDYKRPKTSKNDETQADLGTDRDDIAVVQFAGGLPRGYYAVTLLPSSEQLFPGENVLVAGYGATESSTAEGAGILREVTVQIKDPHFGKTEVLVDQEGGLGTCHGDSGGPAFVVKGKQYYLWGITNRSYPDKPDDCVHGSVYANINAHRDFIEQAAQELQAEVGRSEQTRQSPVDVLREDTL